MKFYFVFLSAHCECVKVFVFANSCQGGITHQCKQYVLMTARA